MTEEQKQKRKEYYAEYSPLYYKQNKDKLKKYYHDRYLKNKENGNIDKWNKNKKKIIKEPKKKYIVSFYNETDDKFNEYGRYTTLKQIAELLNYDLNIIRSVSCGRSKKHAKKIKIEKIKQASIKKSI